MVSGIRSLCATHEQIILAWTGDIEASPGSQSQKQLVPFTSLSQEDKKELEGEIGKYQSPLDPGEGKKSINYVPVFLDDKIAHGHYEGYCKTGKRSLPIIHQYFFKLLPLKSSPMAPLPLSLVAGRCH
jgi:trehalose 6-phosphate synthase/phosphatase